MNQGATGLTGNYYIVPTGAAIRDAFRLFPRFGDYQKARRYTLGLRFWPTGDTGDRGQVVDLDWELIRSAGKSKIYELRITDIVGGYNNLRIIFWVADRQLPGDPLPRIWILSIMQKKTKRFTSRDTKTFRGRLTVLKVRHYS